MPGIHSKLVNLAASFEKLKREGAADKLSDRFFNWVSQHYRDPGEFRPCAGMSPFALYRIIFTDGSYIDVVMKCEQRTGMMRTTMWPFVSSVRGMGYQTEIK